jgi:hypothetical protein
MSQSMSHFISSASLSPLIFTANANYISIVKTSCPTPSSEGTPCNQNAWRSVMKFLSRMFGKRREMNLTTALERQRLDRTMPGQAGAVAAARLGFVA